MFGFKEEDTNLRLVLTHDAEVLIGIERENEYRPKLYQLLEYIRGANLVKSNL